MKYLVLIPDGATDRLDASSGEGSTPLMAARTANLDSLVRKSRVGIVHTIPENMSPGSDIANLGILGYDPKKYYTGRAPFEAASMGLELGPDDVAYRCNLVEIRSAGEVWIMEDFSAGHISSDHALFLIEGIDRELGNEMFSFYPGVSYRHLMVWRGGEDKVQCTPPHDITGKPVGEFLPQGPGSETIKDIEERARQVLEGEWNHTKANAIWLWGQGKKPNMPSFKERFGLSGSIISAVDLLKGMGISIGLEAIDVPGATGYLDTNYVGKAEYAIESLKERDFVYVHVEAPDEAGHNGDYAAKVQAIEDFDEKVLGTILKRKDELGDFKILILPDHATPLTLRTHVSDPVPFLIYSSIDETDGSVKGFDESILKQKDLTEIDQAHKLLYLFLNP
jgi:2,3-bisphosphoglycerate-independent phosphoglycerate mutase